MPPPLVPNDLYAADRPNAFSPAVAGDLVPVYVPNHTGNTVSVHRPHDRYKVLRTVAVPTGPEHVVPSWDLKTLWVNSDIGNALTPIDPATGTFGKPVAVNDPYNLYFTPDGRYAIVMAEASRELVFRDAHTMAIRKIVPVPLRRGQPRRLLRRRPLLHRHLRVLRRPAQGGHRARRRHRRAASAATALDAAGREDLPGRTTWYIADMADPGSGSWTATPSPTRRCCPPAPARTASTSAATRRASTSPTAARARSRCSTSPPARLTAKWRMPGGGSPDMGGVSADGNRAVAVRPLQHRGLRHLHAVRATFARIPVGIGPHGLCV